jgi:hypothetical protein
MTFRTGIRHALIVLALLPAPAFAQETLARSASDSLLRHVALRVSELEARRHMPAATSGTVDSLLAFYSDSVVYEHPSVGAVVRGKSAMRSGMLRYLASMPNLLVETPRITIGPLVAVLETSARPDPRDPSRPIPSTRRTVRVLEFDRNGLVRRILDYPW